MVGERLDDTAWLWRTGWVVVRFNGDSSYQRYLGTQTVRGCHQDLYTHMSWQSMAIQGGIPPTSCATGILRANEAFFHMVADVKRCCVKMKASVRSLVENYQQLRPRTSKDETTSRNSVRMFVGNGPRPSNSNRAISSRGE